MQFKSEQVMQPAQRLKLDDAVQANGNTTDKDRRKWAGGQW